MAFPCFDCLLLGLHLTSCCDDVVAAAVMDPRIGAWRLIAIGLKMDGLLLLVGFMFRGVAMHQRTVMNLTKQPASPSTASNYYRAGPPPA